MALVVAQKVIVSVLCVTAFLSPALTIDTDETETRVQDDQVVLNITGDDAGMVPYWGNYLYFRLYESGRALCERYEQSETEYKKELVRREFKVDKQEAEAIKRLLEHPDFLKSRDLYPSLDSFYDAFYRRIIVCAQQRKQIVLENYHWSRKKDRNYYPEPVVELMKKVSEILSEN